MATQAAIGHGSKFLIGDGGSPGVYTALAEVTQITPPAFVRDVPDATHMQSPEKWREFIGGLRDPGECTLTLNFLPGGAAQDMIMASFTADVVGHFRIEFPTPYGEHWDFDAWCVGFAPEVPLDGKMTTTARFKLSGKPTFFTA